MASDGLNPTRSASSSSAQNNGMNSPRIQVSLPTNFKMPPRSPSRESVATEMSVSSSYLSECGWNNKLPAHLSFLKAVPENQQLSAYLTPNRGPSPIPGCGGGRFLRVPGSSSGVGVGARSIDGGWWEEETDLNVIKSCAALSKALGLQKSFSTGDIVSLDDSGMPIQHNGTNGSLLFLLLFFFPLFTLVRFVPRVHVYQLSTKENVSVQLKLGKF